MKKTNKLKSKIALLFIAISIALYCLPSVNNAKYDSSKGLGIMVNSALAAGESCVGDSQPFAKAATGALCTCNGQVVVPQTCQSGNDWCSSITCN